MTDKIFNYKAPTEVIAPTEFTVTTADNITLHAVKWIPPTDPKAVIILVHGIAEHSGRYGHVAEAFVDAGFAFYAYDHRSHGKSGGEPRTYFANFDLPVADLSRYVDLVRSENPNKKIFVYGHSMGSLISNLYLLKNQDKIAGWISSGSPLAVSTTVPAFLVMALTLLSKIVPTKRQSKLDPNMLTHDKNIVEAYIADPLGDAQPVRLGMAAGLIANGKAVVPQLGNLRLPILLLHGGEDSICPPQASQWIYNKAGSTDKTLKIYDGLYHEIHNETHFGRIMTDAIEWVSGRL